MFRFIFKTIKKFFYKRAFRKSVRKLVINQLFLESHPRKDVRFVDYIQEHFV